MRYILLISFIFSSLGLYAQNLGFSIADGKTRVQIPIEVYNNLVVVPVVLNGQLPLKFVLDTGVRTAILTDKAFSDILRLPYIRKYTIAVPGNEKVIEAYITPDVSLDLPGVKGVGHAMLVLQEDFLEMRNYMGTDVHGILGYELFSRFIVQIDYEKKILTLYTPERFKQGRKYKAVPISLEDTKPYLFTNIQQSDGSVIAAKLLIDSGASHALLLDAQADKNVTVPERHIESVLGRGLGGTIRGKIGRVNTLEIGDYSIKNVITNYPGPDAYMDSIKYTMSFRTGSLGGDVLSRFSVVYSFPEEIIYLKKNNVFNKEFYYNMGGLTLKAKGSRLRNFEVTDVRENSSADKAGVIVGDIIMAVNGISTSDLNLHIVNGMLNSKPGKKIYLEIQRNGVRVKKEFKLESTI
jgi:hypothetical protein